MAEIVPASTRIHYKRVANIDTDRLQRRYAFLQANRAAMARACDARIEMRFIAREFLSIETELARRSEPHPNPNPEEIQ